MATYEHALEIKEKYKDEIFKIPGVTGVGIGLKIVNGEYTNEYSIRVHVVDKKPPGEVKPEEMIPKEIEGVETDVIEEGYAEQSDMPDVLFKGGIIIGCSGVAGGGTLGCFAYKKETGQHVLLTNQHVLFKGTNVTANGQKVYHPFDFPIGIKEIASVNDNAVLNLDAGIARLKPGVRWLAEIKDISGPIKGIYEIPRTLPPSALQPGNFKIEKTGQRTGHTTGWVDEVHTNRRRKVGDELTEIEIEDCLRILPSGFCHHGDSGSVIIYDDSGSKKVVGLLWGTNFEEDKKKKKGETNNASYATHIKAVVDALGIDIATATAMGQVNTVPEGSNPGSSTPISGGRGVSTGNTPFSYQAQALRQIERMRDGTMFQELGISPIF